MSTKPSLTSYEYRAVAFLVGSALAYAVVSTPASAQEEQELRGITIPLGVYDTHNVWIGTYAGSNGYSGYALHPYDGLWYLIGYSSKGIGYNAVFFYNNKTCSGQPYIYISDESPKLLTFDGVKTLWAPSSIKDEQIVTVQAYSWVGSCYAYPTSQQGIYGAAIAIDENADRWVPPFAVK